MHTELNAQHFVYFTYIFDFQKIKALTIIVRSFIWQMMLKQTFLYNSVAYNGWLVETYIEVIMHVTSYTRPSHLKHATLKLGMGLEMGLTKNHGNKWKTIICRIRYRWLDEESVQKK